MLLPRRRRRRRQLCMAYIIVITSLLRLRPLEQYDYSVNNGVSLSPSHFFLLLLLGSGGGNFSLPTTLGAQR